MTYSAIALMGIFIVLIINLDVLKREADSRVPAYRYYRHFLYALFVFFGTDAVWGILYDHGLTGLVYWDTVFFFLIMAVSVVLWERFVVLYLDRKDVWVQIFRYAGWALFVVQVVLVVVNFFQPIVFYMTETGEYHAAFGRYFLYTAQMAVFLGTAIYTFFVFLLSKDARRGRYLAITFFSLAMLIAIFAQILYPLLPLYAIGYLLGSCVMHTFVVEVEKNEFFRLLAESREREATQKKELGEARLLAYTDSLTGVKSKRAFAEAEERMDARLAAGQRPAFAAAVFDLNDLKKINDIRGHEAGDRAIIAACRQVCTIFQHSPVFRIGGDEFAAILEGQDYDNRDMLLGFFNGEAEGSRRAGGVVVAAGMADYDPAQDNVLGDVFKRADRAMYARKQELKDREGKS